MSKKTGVYITNRKNGSTVYRASLTYKNKHISLGTFSKETRAAHAYKEAKALTVSTLNISDYNEEGPLSFDKWVLLINFRDNGFYFRTPIYLHKTYFSYHLSPERELTFDVDDLFYYSNHQILSRQGYLFVNDYGMQVNVLSRYGVRNHSVQGKDYLFIDGNANNLRYDNIKVLNPYHGVEIEQLDPQPLYKSRIHLNGNYIVGRYKDLVKAAIAYNKAVDYVIAYGISDKNFEKNYIEEITTESYQEIYQKLKLPNSILTLNVKA